MQRQLKDPTQLFPKLLVIILHVQESSFLPEHRTWATSRAITVAYGIIGICRLADDAKGGTGRRPSAAAVAEISRELASRLDGSAVREGEHVCPAPNLLADGLQEYCQ